MDHFALSHSEQQDIRVPIPESFIHLKTESKNFDQLLRLRTQYCPLKLMLATISKLRKSNMEMLSDCRNYLESDKKNKPHVVAKCKVISTLVPREEEIVPLGGNRSRLFRCERMSGTKGSLGNQLRTSQIRQDLSVDADPKVFGFPGCHWT